MSENHQKAVYQLLTEKVIAYNGGLAKALGSVKAAVLLGQLLYWQGKGRDSEWFYKTIEELKAETALSRREQESAISQCKAKGLLHMRYGGIPRRRFFKIDVERLVELLASVPKTSKPVCTKTPTLSARKGQSNTESTQESNIEYNARIKFLKIKKERLFKIPS